MKKWIAVIAALAVLAAIYFLFNPEGSSLFPKCPFYVLTGLKCPGCGSQRAIHHLLHGHVGSAFIVQPLFVLSIPYLLVGAYFEYMGGKQKYPAMRKTLFGVKACIIIFIIVMAYWIGRNIWGW